jgi:hypothetical protein
MLTTGFAQEEKQDKPESDTIRVGGMIIVRKPGSKSGPSSETDVNVEIPKRKYYKPDNLVTNWFIFDFGFSNYNDQTRYASIEAQAFAPGSTKNWFELNTGKSRNINIWFFMQRLNMIKHVVNLKYGLGLELNNYHFEEDIIFNKKPTLVTMSSIDYKKDKLAADYLTVPMMLNFNFTPSRRNGFGFSGGISAGFLYSARHKTKVDDDKMKVKNDFDLKTWKLSYVGELLLGPVKLYGSYALDNMWDRGLDHTPYTVGFRLSNW